jgi:hypothetical protein
MPSMSLNVYVYEPVWSGPLIQPRKPTYLLDSLLYLFFQLIRSPKSSSFFDSGNARAPKSKSSQSKKCPY